MSGRNESGFRLLAINPGSTSTKIAVFNGETPERDTSITYRTGELSGFPSIFSQLEYRKASILGFLQENGIELSSLTAVVGRGGLLRPIPGGTYRITEPMLDDLRRGASGEHASNLGGLIAWDLAGAAGIPAFIVDPVVVDELDELARYSGIPEIPRVSIFHALNQKAVARLAARDLSRPYESCRLIVVHLGGGVSVGAHRFGRVVDVNNALDGEGPFSPERSGGVPAGALVRLCFSGKYQEKQVLKMITGAGGLTAYLGTNDGREIMRRIEAGDREAETVFRAMAYQVAKEAGALGAVLEGNVDAVVLSGGLAHNAFLVEEIRRRVKFLGPVLVYPGEDEMGALVRGALRVLRGEETAREYESSVGAVCGD